MTKSELAFNWIADRVAEGKTVAVTTAMKSTHISPKAYKYFADANTPMFKLNKANELMMAEGKAYVCIATPDMILVKVSAYS